MINHHRDLSKYVAKIIWDADWHRSYDIPLDCDNNSRIPVWISINDSFSLYAIINNSYGAISRIRLTNIVKTVVNGREITQNWTRNAGNSRSGDVESDYAIGVYALITHLIQSDDEQLMTLLQNNDGIVELDQSCLSEIVSEVELLVFNKILERVRSYKTDGESEFNVHGFNRYQITDCFSYDSQDCFLVAESGSLENKIRYIVLDSSGTVYQSNSAVFAKAMERLNTSMLMFNQEIKYNRHGEISHEILRRIAIIICEEMNKDKQYWNLKDTKGVNNLVRVISSTQHTLDGYPTASIIIQLNDTNVIPEKRKSLVEAIIIWTRENNTHKVRIGLGGSHSILSPYTDVLKIYSNTLDDLLDIFPVTRPLGEFRSQYGSGLVEDSKERQRFYKTARAAIKEGMKIITEGTEEENQ